MKGELELLKQDYSQPGRSLVNLMTRRRQIDTKGRLI